MKVVVWMGGCGAGTRLILIGADKGIRELQGLPIGSSNPEAGLH